MSASYHSTRPSRRVSIRRTTVKAYAIVSRDTGHHSKFNTYEYDSDKDITSGRWKSRRSIASKRTVFTWFANSAQHAGTANILKTAEPTIVPTPKSPSVTKVPMTLMNNSGLELAAAITVAPATSSVTFSSAETFRFVLFSSARHCRFADKSRANATSIKERNWRRSDTTSTPNCAVLRPLQRERRQQPQWEGDMYIYIFTRAQNMTHFLNNPFVVPAVLTLANFLNRGNEIVVADNGK